jgi:hypothetical protein
MIRPSTDLAIIRRSLEDVLRRLEGAPQTPAVQQMTVRALEFRRIVGAWRLKRPSDEERSNVMKRVLGIHVELMESKLDSDPARIPDES